MLVLLLHDIDNKLHLLENLTEGIYMHHTNIFCAKLSNATNVVPFASFTGGAAFNFFSMKLRF